MSAKAKTQIRLVEAHGKKIITTSLLVADKFGKRHDNVLRKIDALITSQPNFSVLNFEESIYLTERGKEERFYQMTEEGFAMIAMRFTGKAAEEWQIKFVSAFQSMRRILTEPGRKQELHIKRNLGSEMTDMLKFVRETSGKESNNNHFQNEHLFCNRALTGKWKPIVEVDLDVYDTRLLAAIRKRNSLLMTRYLKQGDRKKPLDEFVAEYRVKHPRLTVVVSIGAVS